MAILSEYTSSNLGVENRIGRAAIDIPSTAVPGASLQLLSCQIVVARVERDFHAGIVKIGIL